MSELIQIKSHKFGSGFSGSPTFTSLKSVKDFLGFEPLSNVWKMP